MIPILDILICTIQGRAREFLRLEDELLSQISANNLEGYVRLLIEKDNKEMSVGKKRQKLLNRATAEYIVFFDDDDTPYFHYVKRIVDALRSGDYDCVGMIIDMTTNGKVPQKCCHSMKYPIWEDKVDGYDYVRNVTHFNPVKRELALQAGFKDLRFGEDKDYSDRLTPLCEREIFISEPLFHYKYSNVIQHNTKYGIR